MKKYYLVSRDFLKYLSYFAYWEAVFDVQFKQSLNKEVSANDMADEYEKDFEQGKFDRLKKAWGNGDTLFIKTFVKNLLRRD